MAMTMGTTMVGAATVAMEVRTCRALSLQSPVQLIWGQALFTPCHLPMQPRRFL